MLQIIEQTDEEKMAMYMKLTKKELIKMLIQANKHLDNIKPQIDNICDLSYYPDTKTTAGNCVNWGRSVWGGH